MLSDLARTIIKNTRSPIDSLLDDTYLHSIPEKNDSVNTHTKAVINWMESPLYTSYKLTRESQLNPVGETEKIPYEGFRPDQTQLALLKALYSTHSSNNDGPIPAEICEGVEKLALPRFSPEALLKTLSNLPTSSQKNAAIVHYMLPHLENREEIEAVKSYLSKGLKKSLTALTPPETQTAFQNWCTQNTNITPRHLNGIQKLYEEMGGFSLIGQEAQSRAFTGIEGKKEQMQAEISDLQLPYFFPHPILNKALEQLCEKQLLLKEGPVLHNRPQSRDSKHTKTGEQQRQCSAGR